MESMFGATEVEGAGEGHSSRRHGGLGFFIAQDGAADGAGQGGTYIVVLEHGLQVGQIHGVLRVFGFGES